MLVPCYFLICILAHFHTCVNSSCFKFVVLMVYGLMTMRGGILLHFSHFFRKNAPPCIDFTFFHCLIANWLFPEVCCTRAHYSGGSGTKGTIIATDDVPDTLAFLWGLHIGYRVARIMDLNINIIFIQFCVIRRWLKKKNILIFTQPNDKSND